MADSTQQPAEEKVSFVEKYKGYIILCALFLAVIGVMWFNRTKGSANRSIVKTDTVSAQYLTAPLGQIASAVVLKYHLSDGDILYGVPTGLDTVKGEDGKPEMDTLRNGTQILMDTVKDKAGKPELDSLLHFKLTPRFGPKMTVHIDFRLPKNVKEIPEISIR